MHRYGETKTEHVSRRRKQGRLCIAATAQRQRQSTPRARQTARIQRSIRTCIATTRAGPTVHRDGESSAGRERSRTTPRRIAVAPLRRHPATRAFSKRFPAPEDPLPLPAVQTMHHYGRATAAAEHASRLLEQDRLCIATAAQRQRHIMHRDGESSADYARIQLSNRTCMRCDGESRPDYASLRRSNGSDRASIAASRLFLATAEQRQGEACIATYGLGLGLLAACRVAPRPGPDGESSPSKQRQR